ncbi:hypothetical protein HYDPIDRAFT_32442 [Hydnomerulius pinastri MD-312]|uniref:Uncharacterized protein n=1 Tax=Hydnomerulius pinastri MD-312 TaxID=994086 RepID=A0A0C9WA02_9AGAM|nr:hypothetical protein HYDPIDRAFT_32442 [Hydnomerulius pinastri MD-312]
MHQKVCVFNNNASDRLTGTISSVEYFDKELLEVLIKPDPLVHDLRHIKPFILAVPFAHFQLGPIDCIRCLTACFLRPRASPSYKYQRSGVHLSTANSPVSDHFASCHTDDPWQDTFHCPPIPVNHCPSGLSFVECSYEDWPWKFSDDEEEVLGEAESSTTDSHFLGTSASTTLVDTFTRLGLQSR